MVAAGYNTAAHGLGGEPRHFQPRHICKVANNGFSIGDWLFMETIGNVWWDATNVYHRQPSSFAWHHKTTGVWTTMTAAHWDSSIIFFR